MSWLDRVHGGFVLSRRASRLARALSDVLPSSARVLDVGSGDGIVAASILALRPDVSIEGVDVLVRPETGIPIRPFDGRTLPAPDDSFDVCMLVDVVHHAEDPHRLLREAARVARSCIVLKDHLRKGLLSGATLHFMDRVGNARHGTIVRGMYWGEQEWRSAWREAGLMVASRRSRLGLYPWWADWWFGRSLHFLAVLTRERVSPGDPFSGLE
jgi:SAM-dependent methyltransferase